MPSKFINKSAQKLSIFSSKAIYARCLLSLTLFFGSTGIHFPLFSSERYPVSLYLSHSVDSETNHATFILESTKRKTTCYYEVDRLTAIENCQAGEIDNLYHFMWEKEEDKEKWNLSTESLEDGYANICICQTCTYDENGDPLPDTLHTPFTETYTSTWEHVKSYWFSLIEHAQNLKKFCTYSTHMEEELNPITEHFFSKRYLQFAGYYSHPIEKGCTPYGNEINDKLRITMINGILNIRNDLEDSLKLFSLSHNNAPIHYVFHPTEGWTKDLLSSSLSKLGFTSLYAKLLAETWKEMINEMGGVGEGGKIIHYAHSIGATDTYVAKNLLSEEERKMIHVISIGSPTMIPENCGFADVINYVSKRDGVCLLDPIGYLSVYIYENTNIELIGTFWGIPFIDHTLYTDTYGGLIQELGKILEL